MGKLATMGSATGGEEYAYFAARIFSDFPVAEKQRDAKYALVLWNWICANSWGKIGICLKSPMS